jgi:hypothetical protein
VNIEVQATRKEALVFPCYAEVKSEWSYASVPRLASLLGHGERLSRNNMSLKF